MKQRVITATLFAAVMLGGIFGGKHSFFVLFALVTLGCLWELYGLLFAQQSNLTLRRALGTGWAFLPYLLFGGSALELWPASFPAPFIGIAVLFFAAVPFFLLELFLDSERPFDQVGRYLLGMFYIGIPFTLLVYLSMPLGEFFGSGEYSHWRVFGLLFLIWSNDSLAYNRGFKTGEKQAV